MIGYYGEFFMKYACVNGVCDVDCFANFCIGSSINGILEDLNIFYTEYLTC